tara:strand:- start:25567 stop:25968 length:402 start_codon:yes stop_codon:yes gene_type:complete
MAALHLSHIKETCLYVSDLNKTAHFYHSRLGLSIVAKVDGRHIFFKVGNCMLLCFLPEVSEMEETLPPHFAKGKQHMAFGIPLKEYEDWKKKLIDLRIPITYEHHWRENIYSLYFEDPDGNVLEIVPNELWDN